METPIYYSPTMNNLYKLNGDSNVESNNQRTFVTDTFSEFMLAAQQQHEMILEQLQCMNQYICQNSIQYKIQQGSLNNTLAELSNGYQSFKKTVINEIQNLNGVVDTLSDNREQTANRLNNELRQMLLQQRNLLMNNQQILQEMRPLSGQLKQTQEKLLNGQNLLQTNMNELFRNLNNTLQSNLQTIIRDLQNTGSNLQQELASENKLHIEHQLQNEEQYNQLLENIVQLRELLNPSPYFYLRLGDRITLIDRNGNTFSGVFIETTENEIIWVNTATMSLSISNKKGLTISKV